MQHIQYTCKHTLPAPSSICVLPFVKTHPVRCHSFSCMWLVKTTNVSTRPAPSLLSSPSLSSSPSTAPPIIPLSSTLVFFSPLGLYHFLPPCLTHGWIHLFDPRCAPSQPKLMELWVEDGVKCLCNVYIKPCPASWEVLMCERVCVH